MRYRISEVKISARQYADREHRMEHIEAALKRKLKKTGGRGNAAPEVSRVEIIRESIDARHKPDVMAVYTLDFDCPRKLRLPEGAPAGYNSRFGMGIGREKRNLFYDNSEVCPGEAEDVANVDANREAEDDGFRPVVAGFGPCGIFAALTLAQAGLRPIVLERGKPVEQRTEDVRRFWEEGILDPESNVQFGEGGAGTFSDGKLTTGIKDRRIRRVLEVFVEAGAEPEILYQQRPHIGTDRLAEIIPKIRERIRALGGEVLFGTKLCGLEYGEEPGGRRRLAAVLVHQTDTGKQLRIPARDLILAIGHSARDTFGMLADLQLPMQQKAFSIGVRIRHPQSVIDAAQYGDPALAEVFGPAAYKLNHRCENGRGVYTFCMCPGGKVINASSEMGGAVTNGMSNSRRDSGWANSGLLVDVRPADFGSDDPLAGVAFQRKYEELAWKTGRDFPEGLPRTRYADFRGGSESGPEDPGSADPGSADPVRKCLPAFAAEAICEAMPHLGRKLPGFDAEDAEMTAVETRSSSPVRILRDTEMQSGIEGMIPAGEGPGYAGGIMSAAVDGIRAAEKVRQRCRQRTEDRPDGEME